MMGIYSLWRTRTISTIKQISLLKRFVYQFYSSTSPEGRYVSTLQCHVRHFSSLRERKRFYQKAGIEEAEGGYQITLDNKNVKTPAGSPLIIPSKPLAMAVAVEWNAQTGTIKPDNMHLTSLSNTVIDNPRPRTPDQQAVDILEYLRSDTICFYVEEPEELLNLQRQKWEPLMKWFTEKFNVMIEPSTGIGPVSIADDCLKQLEAYLVPVNLWSLTGLEFAVETLKSFILAMALVENHLTVETAVFLSRLEVEFQISRWGSVEWAHDVEVMESRSRVAAAALFYSLNNRTLQPLTQ